MDVVQSKMKKWLKGFSTFFQICVIFLSIGLGGVALSCLIFAFNKNAFYYELDETTTVRDLFADLDITSRWDLVGLLVTFIVYFTILLSLLIMIRKWFKSASISGEPFSNDSIKLMNKISRFAITGSIIGFIFETILFMFIDVSVASSYESILFAGLLIKCLSFVFAYANVTRKEDLNTVDEFKQIENDKS